MLLTSQEGFEPPTDSLEGCCSILLSYWDKATMRLRKTKIIIGSPLPKVNGVSEIPESLQNPLPSRPFAGS